MNGVWPILLVAAIALAVVVVGSVMEGRRRKTLADFARRIGFRFDPGAGGFDPEQFHGYTPFEQGGSRRFLPFLRLFRDNTPRPLPYPHVQSH